MPETNETITVAVVLDAELAERVERYGRERMPGTTSRATIVRQLLHFGLEAQGFGVGERPKEVRR